MRTGAKSRVALAIAVLILASGCWVRRTPPTLAITWYTCTERMHGVAEECGYLRVPTDPRRPNGETTLIAVSRRRHRVPDSEYQGVMLVNPGGPGGSGVGLIQVALQVPGGAADAYDWIGFDPRGVGSSAPPLSCQADYHSPKRPDYVPTTPELEQVWLDRSRGYAEACRAGAGATLDHMSTVQTARDMDSIRAALGVSQINYYGYSYGTYLGQVYATLFPQRVRRMVLDSNVDPRTVGYQSNLDQNVPLERVMDRFFAWLARHDAVYDLGATAEEVRQRYLAEQDRLRAEPAGDTVGPSEWTDIFLRAAYYQSLWPGLGDAFADWVHTRDPGPLVSEYIEADAPGYDNLFAVYQAVQCRDGVWPRSWEQWRDDAWRVHESAPTLTWANTWFNAPCLFWPAAPEPPVQVDGTRVPGILLIVETLDAATPYEGSVEVRRRFPQASLLAQPDGTTHAASLHGNPCVDDIVATYLRSGELPPRQPGDGPDATCEPLPEPAPSRR